jgi:hypothetical protein
VVVYNEYGSFICEVDMAWRELKIAGQYEGAHHRGPEQFAIIMGDRSGDRRDNPALARQRLGAAARTMTTEVT